MLAAVDRRPTVNGRHDVGEVLEAVARLAFRHPSTGDEAVLSVDRIEGPGAETWWRVFLDCTPGSPPAKAGPPAIAWCRRVQLAETGGFPR